MPPPERTKPELNHLSPGSLESSKAEREAPNASVLPWSLRSPIPITAFAHLFKVDVDSNNLTQEECLSLANMPPCNGSNKQPEAEGHVQESFSLAVPTIQRPMKSVNSRTDRMSKLPSLPLGSRQAGGSISDDVLVKRVDKEVEDASVGGNKLTFVAQIDAPDSAPQNNSPHIPSMMFSADSCSRR